MFKSLQLKPVEKVKKCVQRGEKCRVEQFTTFFQFQYEKQFLLNK